MLSHLALAGMLLALAAPLAAQNPPPAEVQAKPTQHCRNDRPVEDYIAEMNKAKKQRNKNPLPNSACILGWCKGSSERKPETRQTPAPPPQPSPESTTESSSSKQEAEPAATHDPYQAAQDVEVGDYYFSEKKYRAALSRYQDALEAKPDDAAIYLRLGRTFEKLDEPARAYENYDASLVADPAGPSREEAGKSTERLRPEVEKGGGAPAAISARNRARITPRCRAESPAPPAPPR